MNKIIKTWQVIMAAMHSPPPGTALSLAVAEIADLRAYIAELEERLADFHLYSDELEKRIAELESRPAPVVAEGLVLAPLNPSSGMLERACKFDILNNLRPHGMAVAEQIYEAMIATWLAENAAHPVAGSPANCVGCEGAPSEDNNPCGVCGKTTPTDAGIPQKLQAWRDGAGIAELGESYGPMGDEFAQDVITLMAAYKARHLLHAAAEPMPASEARSDWSRQELLDEVIKLESVVELANRNTQMWKDRAAPVPVSEAANDLFNPAYQRGYKKGWHEGRNQVMEFKPGIVAAPAAPTDAKPDDQDALWLKDAELWRMWHQSQAEHPRSNDSVRSFARKVIAATVEQSIRESVLRSPATAQSVRDAAQPTIAAEESTIKCERDHFGNVKVTAFIEVNDIAKLQDDPVARVILDRGANSASDWCLLMESVFHNKKY